MVIKISKTKLLEKLTSNVTGDELLKELCILHSFKNDMIDSVIHDLYNKVTYSESNRLEAIVNIGHYFPETKLLFEILSNKFTIEQMVFNNVKDENIFKSISNVVIKEDNVEFTYA